MKVILQKDVPGLGKKFDVRDVSDGYAKNFLIPKKIAEIAKEGSIAQIELTRKTEENEKNVRKNLQFRNIEDLNGLIITIREKANEQGHLFAGIHAPEIVEAIRAQTRLGIAEDCIQLKKAIRALGSYEIEVRAGTNKAQFTLVVENA